MALGLRTYINTYAEAAALASYPGAVMTPREMRNQSDGYTEEAITAVVPGAANDYTLELSDVVFQPEELVVSFGVEDPLAVVDWDVAPGANEVAVNWDLPLFKFHSSREASTVSLTCIPHGTHHSAGFMNWLQAELVATQTALDGALLSVHDQNTDTGTTSASFEIGSALDPAAATISALFGDASHYLRWNHTNSRVEASHDVSAPAFHGSGAGLTGVPVGSHVHAAADVTTGVLEEARGGLGTDLSAASNFDVLYGTNASTYAGVTGNDTATRKFLRQVGAAGNPTAPEWDTIAAGDIPATLTTAHTMSALLTLSAGLSVSAGALDTTATLAAPTSGTNRRTLTLAAPTGGTTNLSLNCLGAATIAGAAQFSAAITMPNATSSAAALNIGASYLFTSGANDLQAWTARYFSARKSGGGVIYWDLNTTSVNQLCTGPMTMSPTGAFTVNSTTLGFFNATAVAKPAAYTQTYATASRTHAAYTADDESVAYTGAADSEAKLADLNALRVAYENLRTHHASTAQVLNQLIDDLQSYGLLQ